MTVAWTLDHLEYLRILGVLSGMALSCPRTLGRIWRDGNTLFYNIRTLDHLEYLRKEGRKYFRDEYLVFPTFF